MTLISNRSILFLTTQFRTRSTTTRCSSSTRQPSRCPSSTRQPLSAEDEKPLNEETRIMQRWRYMGFAMVALVTLAMPAWLPAQEPAKKGDVPKAAAPVAKDAQAPAPTGAATE